MFRKFILLIGIWLPVSLWAQEAKDGFVDVSNHDFVETPCIELNGTWKFYSSNFVDPDNISSNDKFGFIETPSVWGDVGLPNFGYGTYVLTIKKDPNDRLALRIPDFFSAYHLYVNGELVAEMGTPGTSKSTEVPKRLHRLVLLNHFQGSTLEVVIHISNYVHRKGGIDAPIQLGLYDALVSEKFYEDAYDLFLAGCMVIAAFFFLGLFSFGRQEKMALYFALFCLVYAYRIVGWGNYVLHDLVDLPYHLAIRTEYATLYLLVTFFSLYISHLFPRETPKMLARIFIVLSIAWAASAIVLPVRIFSYLNLPFIFIVLGGMVMILFVFARALINKRLGAQYSVFSTIGIVMVFAMMAFNYLEWADEIIWVSMLGQLIFVLSQSLILSKHFTESWRTAKRQAEDAAKVKSDFLSIMSHEIRTPLNTVIGTTYHLMDENPRKDQESELNNLKNASEYLLTLINNVLDYSKIDAGKLEFDLADTRLKNYTENIFNVFKPISKQKGLTMKFSYDDTLPEVVKLDKTRINQILTNLIGNAIKFTERGEIRLAISNEGMNEKEVAVKYEIQDTGIGISNEIKELIFQTFQQANTSITRKYGGTGLGLSITKQLIELMGSEIHIESEPEQGSNFYFTIRLPIGDENELSKHKRDNVDLTGYRILLVEDNHMNILIAKRLLEKWGLSVEVANNGLQALEMMEKGEYDLILMDLQMPEMDGYEATRILRKRGYQLPILALTASAMYEKSSQLNAVGLDGLITKPFDPNDLFQALAEKLIFEKKAS